jgi:hypothetical protein
MTILIMTALDNVLIQLREGDCQVPHFPLWNGLIIYPNMNMINRNNATDTAVSPSTRTRTHTTTE